MVLSEVRQLEDEKEGQKQKSHEHGWLGSWQKERSHGQSYGGWNHSQFHSCLGQSMIHFPSLQNFHQWGLTVDPICKLCGGRGTMEQILSCCKVVLWKYRWRHDRDPWYWKKEEETTKKQRQSRSDLSEREILVRQQSRNSTTSWTRAMNEPLGLTLARSLCFLNVYRQSYTQTL